MKTTYYSKNIALLFLCFLTIFSKLSAQSLVGKNVGGQEDYRRSTLCLLLVTHAGDKYNEEIKEQFMKMPMPGSYNSLNIDVRIIDASGLASTSVWQTDVNSLSNKKLSDYLQSHGVAKELVGKWFNRDSKTGHMNTDRITKWGSYNATYADLKRVEKTVRGTAALSDEGEELIENTFVMVCDMSYYDRAQTGGILSSLGKTVSKDENASFLQTVIGEAVKGVGDDLKGFSIAHTAYLYKLRWDKSLLNKVYGQFWVDSQTSDSEARKRKEAFDADNTSFQLDYLGKYYSHAGMTTYGDDSLSTTMRMVCAKAVDENITMLARMYPVFKPSTSYTCDHDKVYAHIGTKEGVTTKSKYEVLERVKADDGYSYKRVTLLKPVKGEIMENADKLITSTAGSSRGTAFVKQGGGKTTDICDRGLLMREAGGVPFTYSRNWNFFYEGYVGCPLSLNSVEIESGWEANNNLNLIYGGGLDIVRNYSPRFSWNWIGIDYMTGKSGENKFEHIGYHMGFVLRSDVLARKFTLFAWPQIGYTVLDGKVEATFTGETAGSYGRMDVQEWKESGLDWKVKLGTYIGKSVMVSGFAGNHRAGLELGFSIL